MFSDSLSTFGNFGIHFLTGIIMLIIGIVAFAFTTKHKEFDLIKNKNTSAALVLGGRVIGLVLVLGGSVANSISYSDFVIWGLIGIIAQIISFYLISALLPKIKLEEEIENNNVAIAVFVMSSLVAVGYFIAKCMTY